VKPNHLPPYSVEIKNEWSHTSAVSIRLQGVHGDSFNFAFRKEHLGTQHVGSGLVLLSERFKPPTPGAAAACVVAGSFNVVAFG